MEKSNSNDSTPSQALRRFLSEKEHGQFQMASGSLKQAEVYFKNCLYLAQIHSSIVQEMVNEVLLNLGCCYRLLEKFHDSVLFLERALDFHCAGSSGDLFDKGLALRELAMAYYYLNEPESAYTFALESLSAEEKNGKDQVSCALSHRALAMIQGNRGEYSLCLSSSARSLFLIQNLSSPSEELLASGYRLLAYANFLYGDFTQGTSLYTLALESDTQTGFFSKKSLAFVNGIFGNFQESAAIYEELLSLVQGVSRNHNCEKIAILTGIGYVYRKLGYFTRGERHLREAQGMCHRIFGKNSPEEAVILSELGQFCIDQGNELYGRLFCENGLKMAEHCFGSENPNIIDHLRIFSRFYRHCRQFRESQELCKRALSLCKNHLSSKHPLFAKVLTEMGLSLSAAKHYLSAAEHLYRSATILNSVFDKEHPLVDKTLKGLLEARTKLEKS